MKRPKFATVRLTDDEHRRAAAHARKAERPLSDFIRRVLLDHMVDLEVEAMRPFLAPETKTQTIPEPIDPAAPKSNRIKRPDTPDFEEPEPPAGPACPNWQCEYPAMVPDPAGGFICLTCKATTQEPATPPCPACHSISTTYAFTDPDGDDWYRCEACGKEF